MTVRELLEPALAPGMTWDEVLDRLKANTAQLWVGDACAMVTELYLDEGLIHVWLGGGSLKGLLELAPKVIETSRYWGATRATIHGRKGWVRILHSLGFRRSGEILELAI